VDVELQVWHWELVSEHLLHKSVERALMACRISEAEIVKFNEDGKHFAILTPNGIDVYTTVSI
jgi:hypothetical protein